MAYADIFDGATSVYRLNEAGGATTALDSSGNGNNSTTVAGATFGQASINGITADTGVLLTTASSGRIEIPVAPFARLNGFEQGKHLIGVSFWVSGPAQTDRVIIGAGRSSSDTPFFAIGTNTGTGNKCRVRLRDDGNRIKDLTGSITIMDNSPHHVAVVVVNQRLFVYVDGVLDIDYGAFGPTNSPGATTLDQAAIGCLPRTSNSLFWGGTIQDVALWTRGLTPDEVTALSTGTPAASEVFNPTRDDPVIIRHDKIKDTRSRDIVVNHPGGDMAVSIVGWGSDLSEAFTVELDSEGANSVTFQENIGQDGSGWHEAGTVLQNVLPGQHTIKLRRSADFEFVGACVRVPDPATGVIAENGILFSQQSGCVYNNRLFRIFPEMHTSGWKVWAQGQGSVRLLDGESDNYQDKWHMNGVCLAHPNGVAIAYNHHGNGPLDVYFAPNGNLAAISAAYQPGTNGSTYMHGAVLDDGRVALLIRESAGNCGLRLISDIETGSPSNTLDIVFAETNIRQYPIRLQKLYGPGGEELLAICIARRQAVTSERWINISAAVYDVAADRWYSIDKAVSSTVGKGTSGTPRFSSAEAAALVGSGGCSLVAQLGGATTDNLFPLNGGSCIFNADDWDTSITAFLVYNERGSVSDNSYGDIGARKWIRAAGATVTTWEDGTDPGDGATVPDLPASNHIYDGCCLIPKDGDPSLNTAYALVSIRGTRLLTTYLDENYTPYLDSWGGRNLYLYRIENFASGVPQWYLLDTREVSGDFLEGWAQEIHNFPNAFIAEGQANELHEERRQMIPLAFSATEFRAPNFGTPRSRDFRARAGGYVR